MGGVDMFRSSSLGYFFMVFYWIFYVFIFHVILSPGSPLSHPPSPCFSEDAHPPTHSFPPQHPNILLHWGNEPSQDQGLLLLLMPDNAILCYRWVEAMGTLCCWFSPWELWGIWLIDIVVLPMGLQIPSAPSVFFSNSFIWGPRWLTASIIIYISKALADLAVREKGQV